MQEDTKASKFNYLLHTALHWEASTENENQYTHMLFVLKILVISSGDYLTDMRYL